MPLISSTLVHKIKPAESRADIHPALILLYGRGTSADDPVVPVRLGRRAHALLSKTNVDLTYKEYPIPHTISEQSLKVLSDWLEKKLAVPEDMKLISGASVDKWRQ